MSIALQQFHFFSSISSHLSPYFLQSYNLALIHLFPDVSQSLSSTLSFPQVIPSPPDSLARFLLSSDVCLLALLFTLWRVFPCCKCIPKLLCCCQPGDVTGTDGALGGEIAPPTPTGELINNTESKRKSSMRNSLRWKANEHGQRCKSVPADGKSPSSQRVWPQKHEQGILSLSGEKASCQLCGTHRNIWHNHKNKQSLPPDLVTLPQGIMWTLNAAPAFVIWDHPTY